MGMGFETDDAKFSIDTESCDPIHTQSRLRTSFKPAHGCFAIIELLAVMCLVDIIFRVLMFFAIQIIIYHFSLRLLGLKGFFRKEMRLGRRAEELEFKGSMAMAMNIGNEFFIFEVSRDSFRPKIKPPSTKPPQALPTPNTPHN